MEQRSDIDLVEAVCQGQRSAYAVLVRRYYSQVFLVCLGVVGNVHDAEDVAQDTMVKGLERIRQLRDPDQFGHWIVKIARNLSINCLRRRAAAERLVGQRRDEPLAESTAADDLHRAVARLPRDLRLPLVMYYFDGRSVKSVAQTLDISTSGVYLKLRMALRELHDILTAQGETP
ncbi:MAG: sigma-70 family RNA polymerase sigma factor [Sedimentisphaerales bacterium]|nr:sigma-70 family RNA polymerase sigma factor [Sedimentisphaerales bacterium]